MKQFGTLEGILAGTDQLKGKQKENLENFAEQARLSYRLATIDLNVPIQFDASRYILEPFDKPKLEELFKDLEFRSLATQILGQGEKSAPTPQQGDLFAPTNEHQQQKYPKQKEILDRQERYFYP